MWEGERGGRSGVGMRTVDPYLVGDALTAGVNQPGPEVHKRGHLTSSLSPTVSQVPASTLVALASLELIFSLREPEAGRLVVVADF